MQIDWFDLNGSANNFGWLSDEPDREERTETKPEEKVARIVVVAGMANEKGKLLENIGVKISAQELGTVSTVDVEQEAGLKQFAQERVEDNHKAVIAQHPAGDACDMKVIQTEPDNCLSATGGVWWEDDDLLLAYTYED